MRKVLIVSILAAACVSLAACGEPVVYADRSYSPAVAAEVVPVVVAQPDPSTSMLTGMMLGHALSGGFHGGSYHHTTIINRTTYVRPYARPSYFGRGFRRR